MRTHTLMILALAPVGCSPVEAVGDASPEPVAVLSGERILALQHLVRRVPVPEHVFIYARDLTRASRPDQPEATPTVKACVAWGAGPRAGQSLILSFALSGTEGPAALTWCNGPGWALAIAHGTQRPLSGRERILFS